MSRKVVLHGEQGKSVEIMTVTPWFMKATTGGGLGELPGDAVTIDFAENEAKRIEISRSMPMDRAIENSIAAGFTPDFTRRYLYSLRDGGETTAGGFDLARKRTFKEVPGQALIDFDLVIPPSRWFRDAWVRLNDGVVIDLMRAKDIFAERIIMAKIMALGQAQKDTLMAEFSGTTDTPDNKLSRLDLKALGAQVMDARDLDALCSLWPAEAGWIEPQKRG